MGGRSSSRAREAESMMADENVNTGDENKSTIAWYDFHESEDKWLAPNGEMGEYEDQRGKGEGSGQDDMQSSDKWSRPPSEEDCNIDSNESVAEGGKSDEGGTVEASGQDDMQSSFDKWSPPRLEDYASGIIQIDDIDNTLGHNPRWMENIRTVLCNRLKRIGPQKTADYINQLLNRWKTEKVKFAVAGRGATGKSTFINIFRGIKEGQDGFADVGFGDETDKISEYKHPVNENISFCDLPGLSMKFTKRKFLEMVNLSEYDYIFIFFESVLTEEDEWLTVQIQEKGIPFCLVRSKVDKEVESSKGRQIGEIAALSKIRVKSRDSMAENTAFANAELFLISSEKPHIGEMSKLQDHIKEKLPSNLSSAVMLSLPILTEAIIEQKLLELKKRMSYVSIGTAILTTLTCPFKKNQFNIALIKREVRHYVKVFGLDQKYDERIEGLKNNFSEVSVDHFVERMLNRNYPIKVLTTLQKTKKHQSIVPLTVVDRPYMPVISDGYETKILVDALLPDILSELKQDAIVVYMHLLNKGSR